MSHYGKTTKTQLAVAFLVPIVIGLLLLYACSRPIPDFVVEEPGEETTTEPIQYGNEETLPDDTFIEETIIEKSLPKTGGPVD